MEALDLSYYISGKNGYVIAAYLISAALIFMTVNGSLKRTRLYKERTFPKVEPIKFHYP